MEMVGRIVLPRVGNATLDSAGTKVEYREFHALWAATTILGGRGDNAYLFLLVPASQATCLQFLARQSQANCIRTLGCCHLSLRDIETTLPQ
jgi:hypothetical protein